MADEQGFTSVGTYIEVASGLPTANTSTAFAALTGWTEVGGVDSIGEIKMTRNTSSRTPLKDGVEVVVAGSASFDAFTVDGAIVRGDEGQELLESSLRSGAKVSFCINYPDGGKEYGTSLVTSGGRAPGADASAFAGMAYELKPSGATVIVDPV